MYIHSSISKEETIRLYIVSIHNSVIKILYMYIHWAKEGRCWGRFMRSSASFANSRERELPLQTEPKRVQLYLFIKPTKIKMIKQRKDVTKEQDTLINKRVINK